MTEVVDEVADYDARYVKGVQLFNQCEFFEAHDVWEELWTEYRGESRDFYKGLIQVAVALHHFGNENIRGAKKLYHSSRGYLQAYRPKHFGCDLELLFQEMEDCFAPVLAADEQFPRIAIDPEQIPEIELDPPAASV
jgi:predicted metal-dependent hydrolase